MLGATGLQTSMAASAASAAASSAATQVKEGATKAMEKMKLLVGMKQEVPEPQEQSILDELNQYCALTRKQRLIGFAFCFGAGLLCSLMSMFVVFKPVKFAMAYTIGNLLGLGSTGFLLGPWRQMKMMFDPIRIVATIIYLVSIVLTLFCALYLRDAFLTAICIIVEFCALTWYSLSYIPFAQTLVKRSFASCLDEV